MKRRHKVVALVLLGIAIGAALNYEHRREQARQEAAWLDRLRVEQALTQRANERHFAGCPIAGHLDRVVAERVGTAEGTLVQGWLIAPDGGAELRLDGAPIAVSVRPSEARNDVRDVFPACRAAAASGFSIRLPGALEGEAIQLAARAGAETRIVDQRPYPVGGVRVELDPLGDIEPNGRNIVSGWAISADGAPVDIEIVARDRVIARSPAIRARTDAAARYPRLPHAGSSGFDLRIPFGELPRGSYRLQLRATSGNRRPLLIDGPLVRNDHPFGLALTLKQRAADPSALNVVVWLAHEAGIRRVELATEDGDVLAPFHRERSRVRFGTLPKDLVRDALPPLDHGSIWSTRLRNSLPPGIHRLEARVETGNGVHALVPAQLVLNTPRQRVRPIATNACEREPLLVFYPAGPGTMAGLGAQREALSLRSLVEGPCVRVGMRMRVEYLRTTRGRRHDYAFDPYFRSSRVRVPGKSMTTAGLDEALQLAARHDMPLLVSLDGGVWADSAFAAPEWDAVDHLEEDEDTVQWNQHGRSEPDDALTNMPGATDQPQIARMMSLNQYNQRFRAYKKRNLQAAVAHIVAHVKRFPRHAVWINLDSDNYINPWFKATQWYDYNPATLRQFREWLTASGPYAAGQPLASEGLAPSLDLTAINRLAKSDWQSLSEVDAPRGALDATDPWYGLWIRFKRHLVARHYSDLSDWACAAGLSPDHIYSAVGISDSTVAKEIEDGIRGWNDQSGVSLRGGKPHCGHLGVVMYGPAMRDTGTDASSVTGDVPPLASITNVDPAFGVVEFHPADLDSPTRLPSRDESRQSLRNLLKSGARFISPMWGTVASGQVLFPGRFHAYEAMEGTAFEMELVRALRGWNVENSRAMRR